MAYRVPAIAYRLMPIGYCLSSQLLPLTVGYALGPKQDHTQSLIADRLLSIAYCLLRIAYCLLPIAYRLLPIAFC